MFRVLGIHICTDNLHIAKEAGSVPNGSSQAAFMRFREGVKSWLQKRKKMSCQGIIGDERAQCFCQAWSFFSRITLRYEQESVPPASWVWVKLLRVSLLLGWEVKAPRSLLKYTKSWRYVRQQMPNPCQRWTWVTKYLVGSLQLGQDTAISQITRSDLGTKNWMFIADAARNGRFTPFHVRMQDRIRAKLFSLTDKRPFPLMKYKRYSQHGLQKQLFQRNMGHGGQVGL